MNEELKNAIKEIGRKHTELNWYYKAVNGHYDLTDEQIEKIRDIEENYPEETYHLQKPENREFKDEKYKELVLELFADEHHMHHAFYDGVEKALTWVMAANELGIEQADEEYGL